MELKLLNEENFRYLCQGLTLDFQDMQVIDGVLIGLNDKNGLIEKIITQNDNQGAESTLPKDGGGQIIVIFDKYLTSGKLLATATVTQGKDYTGLPPALHINLHSPTLDIPQRIEIPLRYVLKGMPSLKGTYVVYLHALEINDKETFVYYGITKRGWMKRFNEHVQLAVKRRSDRKFPKLLRESIEARIVELLSEINPASRKLTGSYHVVCAAGRSKKNASEIERYLIKKRSLFEKEGLNMI